MINHLIYLFCDPERLSVNNDNFIDEENHVFTICTRATMQELLDCSKGTAIKAIKSLVEEGTDENRKFKIWTSKNCTTGGSKNGLPEVQNLNPNINYKSNNKIVITNTNNYDIVETLNSAEELEEDNSIVEENAISFEFLLLR